MWGSEGAWCGVGRVHSVRLRGCVVKVHGVGAWCGVGRVHGVGYGVTTIFHAHALMIVCIKTIPEEVNFQVTYKGMTGKRKYNYFYRKLYNNYYSA